MLTSDTLTYRDLPGPRGLPLLGNRLDLALGGGPGKVLTCWSDRYGPTYRLRLPAPAVVTADPLLVDAILRQRPGAFRRSPRVSGVLREMGIHGVFTAEGAEWHRLRRIAARSLDAAHLKAYFATLTRTADRLHRRWTAAAATNERIDVLDEMMRYTLDVTVGLAAGHDLNAVENRGEDGLAARLPELFPEIGRRLYAPVPYWRLLPSARRRRLEATLRELGTLVDAQFAAARQRFAEGAPPANFLEALFVPGEGEPELTTGELTGNVLTMLLAGEDTTSATIAWTLHYLAHDPARLRRVRHEAQAVLGDRPVADDPATLRKLVYADAAVKEAVRLRPVAPYLAMQACHDVVLPGQAAALGLDAGTIVFVLLTRGARHDTARFPDSDEFRPDRWLDGGPPADNPTAPFLPFGGGPRFCPGRNLALVEATLVTSMLCRAFDLQPDTWDGPVGERSAFSVFPTGLYLRAQQPRPAAAAEHPEGSPAR
ncbi:cytochrome P450 [Micromonospora andamanensis]|uniref:Cytochrome P450 n=1 Tax=Micromonospora andamanensis TaxID=1287068 RepID=A0ABQ4I308_9ACTN|nr:cytochrome P450 [Micromonospora andamanensis]GIJ12283.1 cytochrome P450 [Micromonospora andamanensis]